MTAECSCGYPGLTYEGPEEDCDVHGLSCVTQASCEIGDHTRTWPCEYAPGTGALAVEVSS